MNQGNLPDYLASLNPEQRDAVCSDDRRLLILAGAGTGKTRVITSKIVYLVREKGIHPESILAVTFTNKAALEMRTRAESIEPRCSRAVLKTFHAFGAWFMRMHASAFGLKSSFTIYDEEDSAELVHSAFPSLPKKDCSEYAFLIARAKDYCLSPDAPNLDFISDHPEFRRIYAAYEQKLRATGNVDFGDLILMPATLLERDEAIRNRTRQRFRVILVDEYQDSNVAQFRLLQQLTGPDTMLVVVGDDDQSIYRFRGAEVRNILNFQKVFPGTRILRLERNYRSSQTILDIAGEIVRHNTNRLGKRLWATRPGGRKPQLAILDDMDQEVQFCAALARRHVRAGGAWSDIAILYRTNAQSLAFEREFTRMGIPYRLVGALRFYEREEIKDILAFLSFLANQRDEISFRRIVNKPARGLGETSVNAILDAASSADSILAACRTADSLVHGKGREGLQEFLSVIDLAFGMLGAGASVQYSENVDLGQLIATIAEKSGLLAYHRLKDDIAGSQKAANIEELINAASEYPCNQDGLLEFLDTVMLDRSMQQSADTDAVTLITMHNTKGLEFPIVIVTGLEQGLFPREDDTDEDLEEQRRLFYVAVTRAEHELYLTACKWRRIHGRLFETQPSRFLTEISPDFYELWSGSQQMTTAFLPQSRRMPETSQTTTRQLAGSAASGSLPGTAHQSLRGAKETSTLSQPGADTLGWAVGMQVYHDEYGTGVIIKVSPSQSSGPLVIVRFDSGKVAQFFPKYTKKLERIEQ